VIRKQMSRRKEDFRKEKSRGIERGRDGVRD
jgi:hypothetical protein